MVARPRHAPGLIRCALLLIFASAGDAVAAPSDDGCSTQPRYAVVLHGGAFITRQPAPEAVDFLRKLVEEARTRLAAREAALDVVTFAVVSMEDSGHFNAGRGAFHNSAGIAEFDAGIMLGSTLQVGAIASMRRIANPILAARFVMEKTPHVLLAGPAGEGALEALGLRLRAVADTGSAGGLAQPASALSASRAAMVDEPPQKLGTVGAVALDRCGVIAAATSTGGTQAKLPGRVGDTPIPGAGVYADARVGISSTGIGEFFIRRLAAHEVAVRVRYEQMPLGRAMQTVLDEDLRPMGGLGAMIGIDGSGNIHVGTNTTGVLFALASETQAPFAGRDPRTFDFERR